MMMKSRARGNGFETLDTLSLKRKHAHIHTHRERSKHSNIPIHAHTKHSPINIIEIRNETLESPTRRTWRMCFIFCAYKKCSRQGSFILSFPLTPYICVSLFILSLFFALFFSTSSQFPAFTLGFY